MTEVPALTITTMVILPTSTQTLTATGNRIVPINSTIKQVTVIPLPARMLSSNPSKSRKLNPPRNPRRFIAFFLWFLESPFSLGGFRFLFITQCVSTGESAVSKIFERT